MKRLIYTQPDGTVAIVIPTGETTIEHIIENDLPKGVAFEIVDTVTIPADRTFRNAWVKDSKTVKTDISKVKLIAHDRRRAKRAKELAPLDVEATIPAKANQAEAARQVIRDKHAVLQTAIDNATTEAALKQLLINAGA